MPLHEGPWPLLKAPNCSGRRTPVVNHVEIHLWAEILTSVLTQGCCLSSAFPISPEPTSQRACFIDPAWHSHFGVCHTVWYSDMIKGSFSVTRKLTGLTSVENVANIHQASCRMILWHSSGTAPPVASKRRLVWEDVCCRKIELM